jgi:GTPase-activator protein for Ras-like GTPase
VQEEVRAALGRLRLHLVAVVDAVVTSTLPVGVAHAAHLLVSGTQAVLTLSDADRYALIGSFLILRFINPALVQPVEFGVDVALDVDSRRNIVVVARALQMMANQKRFGGPEPVYDSFNATLVAEQDRLHKWFDAALAFAEGVFASPLFERTLYTGARVVVVRPSELGLVYDVARKLCGIENEESGDGGRSRTVSAPSGSPTLPRRGSVGGRGDGAGAVVADCVVGEMMGVVRRLGPVGPQASGPNTPFMLPLVRPHTGDTQRCGRGGSGIDALAARVIHLLSRLTSGGGVLRGGSSGGLPVLQELLANVVIGDSEEGTPALLPSILR